LSGLVSSFFFPLIASNILHMFVVKFDLWPKLKVPIQHGLFGPNKTYRGLLFVSLATGILAMLASMDLRRIAIGSILGFTYIIFELPNSYLKRSLGIGAGEKSKKHRILFTILDKTDSCLGVCAVYSLFYQKDLLFFFSLFFCSIGLHFIFSYSLVLMGVKKSL
jgi:hypothetical protein